MSVPNPSYIIFFMRKSFKELPPNEYDGNKIYYVIDLSTSMFNSTCKRQYKIKLNKGEFLSPQQNRLCFTLSGEGLWERDTLFSHSELQAKRDAALQLIASMSEALLSPPATGALPVPIPDAAIAADAADRDAKLIQYQHLHDKIELFPDECTCVFFFSKDENNATSDAAHPVHTRYFDKVHEFEEKTQSGLQSGLTLYLGPQIKAPPGWPKSSVMEHDFTKELSDFVNAKDAAMDEFNRRRTEIEQQLIADVKYTKPKRLKYPGTVIPDVKDMLSRGLFSWWKGTGGKSKRSNQSNQSKRSKQSKQSKRSKRSNRSKRAKRN